ncbi:MAG: carbohydrate ABC transporter permease, partial [Clostridia bacterium]|nr:carbohydrate ABC transporter permease [Clostridia bacterium]
MIKSKGAKIADIVIIAVCCVLIFICLVPMLNVLARSLSSTEYLIRNEVLLWPKGLTFEAYTTVLQDAKYTHSLVFTAWLTLGCTILSMVMTIMCAYPLIYDNLRGKAFINGFVLLTMYFSAGTIPHYLLLKNLKMLDTVWVLVIPNCLSVFNVVIMRSFFYGIPDSLREAAEIDGAGPIRTLIQIYLPLSTSVMATLALF